MMTTKSDDIIVSIFFDLQGLAEPTVEQKNKFQIILLSIQIAFETSYLPVLMEWRAAVSSPGQVGPDQSSKIIPGLVPLESIVESLCESVLADSSIDSQILLSNEDVVKLATSQLRKVEVANMIDTKNVSNCK